MQIVIDIDENVFTRLFDNGTDFYDTDDILAMAKAIRKGTPLQEPKTGHWIEHPEIETSAPEYLMFYECSECGDKPCFCKLDIHKKRFCNNCGCRMIEPQESEEI